MSNQQNITDRLDQMGSLVANQINAMLAYWDKDLVCRFANDAYLEWFGKTKEEMIDKMTIDKLLGPTLYQKNLPFITEALKGYKQVFEREIPTPDGKGLRQSLATYFPHVADGEVKGFFVHVADVSYIKQLEAFVSKFRLNMLRDVIEAQEAERAHISSLLRDSVNQTLTHCKLVLQAKMHGDNELANDKILERGIDQAIKELNMLSINLTPSAIKDFGFIAEMKLYIESNMRGIPIKFICKNNGIEELALHDKLSLFRIIQCFLTMVTEEEKQNAVRVKVDYENRKVAMELSVANEDFPFKRDNKQIMDIMTRIEYHNGQIEHYSLKNEKMLSIKISF